MIRTVKNYLHGRKAWLSGAFYGFPAKKIVTIGVTGTDGKTTTAALIYHILKVAGKNPAVITTLGAEIGGKSYDTGFHTTTPSSFALQKYIRKAADLGCKYLVLEVTSHALDQNRVGGIDFKMGVLTNITHEHLDYHKTYENYVEAKTKLLKFSETCIINADDESFKYVFPKISGKKIITYSIRKKETDFNTKNLGFSLPRPYGFNTENFLAAVAAAKMLKISDKIIKSALRTFTLPEGRLEVVHDDAFKVIVDFAHTPNAFSKILPEIKHETRGRLIHVFGAAGERDASKRPLMGSETSKYADIIILTSEDPRREKIEEINKQIRSGISNSFSLVDTDLYNEESHEKKLLFEIPDRKDAIGYAIKIAREKDTVLISGKGHEQSMNLGDDEIPWSEHETVFSAFRK